MFWHSLLQGSYSMDSPIGQLNKTAKLNLFLNKPEPVHEVGELAKVWQAMMPPDGQGVF